MKGAVFVCVLAVIAVVVVADPPKPMWPSSFQSFFHTVWESHGRQMDISGKQYYDYRQKAERFEVQDPRTPSTFDIIIRDYKGMKEYQVLNDETICIVKSLNHSMPVFDFSVFEYLGSAYVDGQMCDHWREDIQGAVDYYDSADAHNPVRVQSSSPQGGSETTDWFQFVPGPQDPILFYIDPAWKCTPHQEVAHSHSPLVMHKPVRVN
eukprot:EC725127.1.p1 GENE.EC725127.1~~EC725127.1.p1  ORF type:complete len:222 (+),score=46.09 EC725127.1:44-667(+)